MTNEERYEKVRSPADYEITYEELRNGNDEILTGEEKLTTMIEELNKKSIELEESRDYAEAIIETMHNPLMVLSEDLQVRMANRAFYQTFKLSPEETEGCLIFDLAAQAWDIPALRVHLKEVFPKNSNFKDFELKHDFRGLGERELIVNAYRLLKDDPGGTLILLAFDDITRRFNAEASLLKSQEQLKLSLIGDSIGTWWWSIPTNEIKWSRENELINGMSEGAFKGLYEHWENLLHPDDVQGVKKAIQESIDKRLPLEIEYRIPWPDNSIHWILSKGHTYYDQYDKPERMIGVSMDCTERKLQSESLERQVNLRTAELLKANKELKAVNEQLEQFAFIASHDLQEPLRKIEIFSDLLSSPVANLNDYAKMYSGKINVAAGRMSRLIKDLLSFSVQGKDERKAVNVDLNETLKRVIEDFEVTIDLKKAIVHYTTLPVIPGEPVQMNQLFHNLIDNALKFSKESPVISITSNEVTADDFLKHSELIKGTHYVSISVNDNGIGFNQKYAFKIFILFQQLVDVKGAVGTGIGLALCKKIIEDHNGFIFADGKVDGGATFTVFLPA